jgi:hypothetical protein
LTRKGYFGQWQTRAGDNASSGGVNFTPRFDHLIGECMDVASESIGNDPAVTELTTRATTKKSKAAADQALVDKLAKRSPPDPVERAQIEEARKRTKARAPRIAMHIEDRGTGVPTLYPDHSDEEGHQYRLADAFGTRSLQFVHSMLKGLGHATADPSLNMGFGPASPDQVAFNAALAVIDGVRPKDEIEAMLAAHMAVANVVLLELIARTRGAVAGHRYEGNGIKRLDVLGNLTTKFMRTYTMQVEALTRKRRKGQQKIWVKHVHVYAGGQAIVGNVSHRGGRGTAKNEQRPYEREKAEPATRTVSECPAVRGANEEWETLPGTSDEKGALPVTRRRKR